MDALRTAASSLSSTDPDLQSNDPAANLRKAIRLDRPVPDDRRRVPSPAQWSAADRPGPDLSHRRQFSFTCSPATSRTKR